MRTPATIPMKTTLIAPCGINCRLCRAYGRRKDPCPGCRAGMKFTGESCYQCSVHCAVLAAEQHRFCFECAQFPCKTLVHLDRRYRSRYGTSPIENLQRIQARGVREFVQQEKGKWACPACGATLCMHDPQCRSCGYRWH